MKNYSIYNTFINIEYLIIHLTIVKMLKLEKNEEDIRQWQDCSCLWIGRINIVQIVTLPQASTDSIHSSSELEKKSKVYMKT